MISKLKKFFTRSNPRPVEPIDPDIRPGFKKIFKEDGHVFYGLGEFNAVVASRYLAFVRLVEMHQLGVSESDLKAFIGLMKESIDRGSISECAQYLGILEGYLGLYTDHKRIFEVANCFILIDDEPHTRFEPKYTRLKKEMYETSDTVKFFFIRYFENLMKDIGRSSGDIKIGDYLNRPEVILAEQLFSSSITSRNLEKSSPK